MLFRSNFNFFTLFSELDPHIHMGGDNVVFWGPLSWAVIYGLIFATFLTLIMVPVMLLIIAKIKHRRASKRGLIQLPKVVIPPVEPQGDMGPVLQ